MIDNNKLLFLTIIKDKKEKAWLILIVMAILESLVVEPDLKRKFSICNNEFSYVVEESNQSLDLTDTG